MEALETRISDLSLNLDELTWALKELHTCPSLEKAWTKASTEELTAFIKRNSSSANQVDLNKMEFPKVFSSSPQPRYPLPIFGTRMQSFVEIIRLAHLNFMNRSSGTQQFHRIGQIIGLSGLGKTSLLEETAKMVRNFEHEEREFEHALRHSTIVYMDLSVTSGDALSVSPFQKDRDIISSRMFSHMFLNVPWARRTVRVESVTPETFISLIGKTLRSDGSTDWRAVFVFVDEIQNLLRKGSEFAMNAAGSLGSMMRPKPDSEALPDYNLFLIPIFVGTVSSQEMNSFIEGSSFRYHHIPITLLKPKEALEAIMTFHKEHKALEQKKVRSITQVYGTIPRMLEIISKVLLLTQETDPNILERRFLLEFANVYKVPQMF